MSGGQLWWGAPWGCLQRWKHCCCLKMKLEIELQGDGFGLHWAHPGQLSSAPSGSPYLCFAGSCRYIIFTLQALAPSMCHMLTLQWTTKPNLSHRDSPLQYKSKLWRFAFHNRCNHRVKKAASPSVGCGKLDCRFHWWPLFITPTNYALQEEREGQYLHLNLCTDFDLVHRNTCLKWRDIMFPLIKNI